MNETEILKRKIEPFLNQNKYLCETDLITYLKQNKSGYTKKELSFLISKQGAILKKHNDAFIKQTMIQKKDYFDNMFKQKDPNIKLDENQIKAILSNENLLVIAGAGSGKTTTMAAKVKYLVDTGHSESKILVISFTNKACDEIENIIHNDLNCHDVEVKTFHSLGLDIIKKSGRDVDKIIEDTTKYKIISNFIKNIAFQNKEYLSLLLETFNSKLYLNENALKYQTYEEYHEIAYHEKYKNSNQNLDNYISNIIKFRRNRKKTIKGEFLRSKEEVDIANFLYQNGLDYTYEKTYKEIINNSQIHPDFYIKQLELENYIEHFGVDQNYDNRMYNEKELKNYLNTLKLKKTYINENDHFKMFITTYSKYEDGSSYLEHLKKELQARGYTLTPKSNKEIFKTLMQTDTESDFSKFIYQVVIPFISIFKKNNYHLEDFEIIQKDANDDIRKQLTVIKPIYIHYQKELEKKHSIDFDDMINLAYELIQDVKENNQNKKYDYLIIDEYQDISNQRYNLTKLFADLYNAKIMAVGDDWQTIYSFAGANLDLITNFQKYIKNSKNIIIENTYRNSQELIDTARDFIQKNKKQIQKKLVSTKHLSKPIEIFIYDDKNKYTLANNHAKAITEIITQILQTNPTHQILLLGRYKKDKDLLLQTDYFLENRGKIKSKLNPNADIEFLTIHSSKGLGRDSVILLNAVDDIAGFPSRIEDIPIIKYLKERSSNYQEDILYPEERRLFYVAMTRTKNKFYIAVPKSKESRFVKEISKSNNIIRHENIIKDTTPSKTNIICPKCGNNLKLVNYHQKDFYIFKCENPKCTFQTMFPNKLEELDICPKCKSIVIYRYKNNKNQKVYKCFNQNCNYQILKEIKTSKGEK